MNLLITCVLIFIGGGTGSLARFGVGKLGEVMYQGKFPLGTLIANVFACLLLGFLLIGFKDKLQNSHEWVRYLLVIGFCGGFSTFSTFSAETIKLLQDGHALFAILNITLSLALGFVVFWVVVR